MWPFLIVSRISGLAIGGDLPHEDHSPRRRHNGAENARSDAAGG